MKHTNPKEQESKSADEILFKHWKAWIEKTFENSEPVTIEQLKEDTSFEQVCIPAMIEFRNQPLPAAPAEQREVDLENILERLLAWYNGKGDSYRERTLIVDCVEDFLKFHPSISAPALPVQPEAVGYSREQMEFVLNEAKHLIKVWHNMGERDKENAEAMWNIYDTHSPEMKRLNSLIASLTATLPAPVQQNNDAWVSSDVDFNSPEMQEQIKQVKKEIKEVLDGAKIDTSKLHITFR